MAKPFTKGSNKPAKPAPKGGKGGKGGKKMC